MEREGGSAVNRTVGIIMGRPYYTVNRPLLRGILNRCYEAGDSAYVFSINEEFYDTETLHQAWNILYAVNPEALDGILYLPYSLGNGKTADRVMQFLQSKCKKPVVMLTADEAPYPSVWFDETAQFRALTAHLIAEHGCRDILCLTGPAAMQTSRSRAQGWREAMQAAGLEAPQERLVYGDFWENSPRELVRRFTDGTLTLPDAVVCGNDRMAITLCDALAAAGIRVPEDLLVTGFDGITEADLHNPSVTSCMPDWEQLGASAAAMLGALMDGKPLPAVQNGGYRLLLSETCGHSRPRAGRDHVTYSMMEARFLDTAINTLSIADETGAELMNSIYNTTYCFGDTNYPEHAKFALCLCSDWNRMCFQGSSEQYRTEGYTGQMLLMQRGAEGTPFPLSRMVPPELDREEPSVTFFVPLYFRNRVFGYTLLRFDGVADSYDIYYLKFCREVGSALSFYCLRSEYRSIAFRDYVRSSRDDLTGLYLLDKSLPVCRERFESARLYGETAYLLGFYLGGLGQIAEVESRVVRDQLLLSFSDLLIQSCRGQEQIYLSDGSVFFVFGSGQQPQARADALQRTITEQFQRGGSCRETVYLTDEVRLFDTAAVRSFSEIETAFHQITERLRTQQQPTVQVKKHQLRLFALREEIYAHPERLWTVEACADHMNMSRSYFHKTYRALFHTNCSEDIQRSKLAYAKKLLLQTDMILRDIAETCGYDYFNFMRAFKKEVGMTPTEYRKGLALGVNPGKAH